MARQVLVDGIGDDLPEHVQEAATHNVAYVHPRPTPNGLGLVHWIGLHVPSLPRSGCERGVNLPSACA